MKKQPSFVVKLTAAFAAFLVVLGTMASVAVFLLRAEVDRAIDRLEERTGRQISIGSIDLSLTEGLAIRDVNITKPESDELHVRVDVVQTDLNVVDLLGGKKRPSEVMIRGLETQLTLGKNGISDFDDLFRRRKKSEPDETSPKPLAVTVADSRILLDIVLPGSSQRTVTLEKLSARANLGGGKAVEFKGKGVVKVDAQERNVDFEIDTSRGGLFRAELDASISIPLNAADNRALLRVQGMTRSKVTGTTNLLGLGLRTQKFEVSIGSLRFTDGGGRYLPKLSDVRAAQVRSFKARWSGKQVTIGEISVDFETGKVLQPIGLTAKAITGRHEQRQLLARLEKLEVGFRDSFLAAALEKRPLAAIETLKVERPFLQVPTADQLFRRVTELSRLGRTQGGEPLEEEENKAGGVSDLRRQVLELFRSMPLTVQGGRILAVDDKQDPIMELTDVDFNASHSRKTGLQIGIDARIVREATPAGKFSIRGTFSEAGDLEVVTGLVKGKDIAHFLSGFSEYVSVDRDSEVEVEFAYTPASEVRPIHRLRVVQARAKNFGFQAWRISHSAVTGVSGEARFTAEYHPQKRHLSVSIPALSIGDAQLKGSLKVTRPEGARPRISATLNMPQQDCAKVAASIPPVLIPRLKGLRVSGMLAFDASFEVDLQHPKTLKLRVDGEADTCRIESLGANINIDALKDKVYKHNPIEPERGRLKHITVGPGTPEWVPSHMLPSFVKAAAVVTEDRSFYAHKGVRWDLVGRALRLDVRKGRFVYGGSTITQQLVKNLFLTREKTLARKLEEIIISAQMERKLTKDEILTLYVNVIEFGPDLYGVKRASRFYFAKEPWNLSPLEAAFIMGLKPYPKAGYGQWERQSLNSWWIKRVVHVLDMIRRREGAISSMEFKAAAPYQPRFRKPEESTFSGRRYARPTALPPSLAPPPPP